MSLKSGEFNPRELRPCSSQNYHIGGVTPVLYPSNNNNNKHTKLTEEKVKQKNLKKVHFKSPPQASNFSTAARLRCISKPSILERIERNELSLKKKLRTDLRISDHKRTPPKCIAKKPSIETENTYLLPDSKEELEMKDIKKIILNKPPDKLPPQFYNNSAIRLVANNLYKWMESIGDGEPSMTVNSLYNLMLNSFEIKPSLAINLQILDENGLSTGLSKHTHELESFTFGHDDPSCSDYFDSSISRDELLRFEKLFYHDDYYYEDDDDQKDDKELNKNNVKQ